MTLCASIRRQLIWLVFYDINNHFLDQWSLPRSRFIISLRFTNMVIFYHSLISYLKYCQISPLWWLSWGVFKCIGKITTWLHNLTSSVFKMTNWFFPNVTVFQIWPVRFFVLVSLLTNEFKHIWCLSIHCSQLSFHVQIVPLLAS